MHKFNYLSILILLFTFVFTSCKIDDDLPVDPSLTKIPMLIIDNPDNYWDQMVCLDSTKCFTIKKEIDGSSVIMEKYNDMKLRMELDSIKRPTSIITDDIKAYINYRGDKAFFRCVVGDKMYIDTLYVDNTASRSATRAVSTDDALNYLKNWTANNGIRYLVNTGADALVPGISILTDYLRETDGMTTGEWANYMIDRYENWDTFVASYLSGLNKTGLSIPEEWLKKLKEMFKDDDEKYKVTPTIIIGFEAGNAPYIYNESAICLLDGYIRAIANDGEFNFDYGICYSTSPNPTINDAVSRKNVQSGFISEITVSLPDKFLLENLQRNTKYYYRAYFKSNIDGYVTYSDNVREFTTSDIPAAITSFVQTNSYHSQNGYSHDGQTFSYKYMTSIKVELTSFDDIQDWGYYYINNSGNRVAYSMMNRGSLRCDDILEYYDNKAETTVYIGCYVKYKSVGDKAFYSDPQGYNLKYNDEVKLSFTDCNYIEVTHDNSLGYYRCGVTFSVTFKVEGSENLTSISILPYGNFLSWNAASYDSPSDGTFTTTITDQYLYEYGLYGNFYCYLYAKDVDGNEYYSDNIIRLYHDGAHFTACNVESYDGLSGSTRSKAKAINLHSVPKH